MTLTGREAPERWTGHIPVVLDLAIAMPFHAANGIRNSGPWTAAPDTGSFSAAADMSSIAKEGQEPYTAGKLAEKDPPVGSRTGAWRCRRATRRFG